MAMAIVVSLVRSESHASSAVNENCDVMEKSQVAELAQDWDIAARTTKFAKRVAQNGVMSNNWKRDWV